MTHKVAGNKFKSLLALWLAPLMVVSAIAFTPSVASATTSDIDCTVTDLIDVVTDSVFFENVDPCTGIVDDADAMIGGAPDVVDDAFDDAGVLICSDENIPPGQASGDTARQTVTGSNTTIRFTIDDFCSNPGVNLEVEVAFLGSTVRWTYTPSEAVEFSVVNDFGGDEDNIFGTYENKLYSTDQGVGPDPVLVHHSSVEHEETDTDQLTYRFVGASASFHEITILGYSGCLSPERWELLAGDFIDDYGSLVGTDISDAQLGDCTCEVQEPIKGADGVYDLAGATMCFDQGFEVRSGDTLRTTLRNNFNGQELLDSYRLGDLIDYQNVLVGSDYTLNAILTVSGEVGVDFQTDNVDSDTDGYRNLHVRSSVEFSSVANSPSGDRYLEYVIYFYESGDAQRTAVEVENLTVNTYDIDNLQYFETLGEASHQFADETLLERRVISPGVVRYEERNSEGSSEGPESRASVTYLQDTTFTFRLGLSALEPDSNDASYQLDFSSGASWGDAISTPNQDRNGGSGIVSSVVKADACTLASSSPAASIKSKSFSGFAINSARLTPAMKKQIRTWLNRHPAAVCASVIGFTMGPRILSSDPKLARDRARAVRAFIKSIRPEASFTPITSRTQRLVGDDVRRAKVTLRF